MQVKGDEDSQAVVTGVCSQRMDKEPNHIEQVQKVQKCEKCERKVNVCSLDHHQHNLQCCFRKLNSHSQGLQGHPIISVFLLCLPDDRTVSLISSTPSGVM